LTLAKRGKIVPAVLRIGPGCTGLYDYPGFLKHSCTCAKPYSSSDVILVGKAGVEARGRLDKHFKF
jgi:hypothetical protein